MDRLQSRVLTASQTLNDITGYTGIEAIKRRNAVLESELAEAQSHVRSARALYKTTNARRSSTQREVTTLLARKDAWSPADLERFTDLYRADHALEGEVSAASADLTEAESDEQRISAALSAGILARYHEEQIWSDRIRRASTWGTWGLMGVNVLLFIVLQFVAEPWKRRRLVRGVVEEEMGVLAEVRGRLDDMKTLLESERTSSSSTAETTVSTAAATAAAAAAATEGATGKGVAASSPPAAAKQSGAGVSASLPVTTPGLLWKDAIRDPKRLGDALSDLYSDRRVDLRMRDLSLLALEAAAAGAAVVGGLALVLIRRS
jgi:sensitive to high expression protein 9